MEVVIKIPDKMYEDAKGGKDIGESRYITQVIKQGKPLPKGHGRLIDANDVDNHIIGSVDLRDCPTIVEADRG